MHLVQFLLPLRDNDGRPFGREAFDKVREELTLRFGGVTAFVQSPAAGLWRQEGETAQDELLLHEVMGERFDRAFWRRYRQELEARFSQEAILMRAMGVETL